MTMTMDHVDCSEKKVEKTEDLLGRPIAALPFAKNLVRQNHEIAKLLRRFFKGSKEKPPDGHRNTKPSTIENGSERCVSRVRGGALEELPPGGDSCREIVATGLVVLQAPSGAEPRMNGSDPTSLKHRESIFLLVLPRHRQRSEEDLSARDTASRIEEEIAKLVQLAQETRVDAGECFWACPNSMLASAADALGM